MKRNPDETSDGCGPCACATCELTRLRAYTRTIEANYRALEERLEFADRALDAATVAYRRLRIERDGYKDRLERAAGRMERPTARVERIAGAPTH